MIVSLLTILIITGIVATYFGIRNELVFKYRVGLIRRDVSKYDKLPSYEQMLFSIRPLKDEYYLEGRETPLIRIEDQIKKYFGYD